MKCVPAVRPASKKEVQTMKKMMVHIYLVIVSIVSVSGMNEASGT